MFNRKNKDNKKKKSWLFWTMLGFYLLKKILSFRKSGELKDIEHNFKAFLHKENREIKEYTKDKEDFGEFVTDSSNIFKDYFLPHSGNNHMPKILRTKSLAIMALLTVLLKFSVVAYLYFIFPNPGKADDAMIAKILALVNQDRSTESLESLSLNPVLSNSALAKANDIVAKDYFAHVSPDGRKPWDWIDRGQYAYAIVGENLAMNFTTAESAHRALINSPSHKRNIMNDKYSDIGLAMVSGEIAGKKTNVLVQMFSTQVERALVKEVEIHNPERVAPEKITEVNIEDGGVEVLSSAEMKIAKKEPATKTPPVEVTAKEQAETPVPVKIIYEPESKKEFEKIAEEKLAAAEAEINDIGLEAELNLAMKDSAIKEESLKEGRLIRVIKHPGDQVLAEAREEKINYKLAMVAEKEQSLPLSSATVEHSSDSHFFLSTSLIRASQVLLASMISLLMISLMINIFVRFEIQHKPVLLRTTLVLLFAIALLFINFHYLEGGVTTIYMS